VTGLAARAFALVTRALVVDGAFGAAASGSIDSAAGDDSDVCLPRGRGRRGSCANTAGTLATAAAAAAARYTAGLAAWAAG
jgi:hypothetical protein